MKKEVYICDVCNNETDCQHLRELESSTTDPSGNGYIDNYKYWDICKICLPDMFRAHPRLTFYGR